MPTEFVFAFDGKGGKMLDRQHMIEQAGYSWCCYLLLRHEEEGQKQTGQGSRTYYVGMTNRLLSRMKAHDGGKSRATAGFQWSLVGIILCKDKKEATTLERWMKTGNSRDKRVTWGILCQSMLCYDHSRLEYMIRRARAWDAQRAIRIGFGLNKSAATREAERDSKDV